MVEVPARAARDRDRTRSHTNRHTSKSSYSSHQHPLGRLTNLHSIMASPVHNTKEARWRGLQSDRLATLGTWNP